MMFSRMITNNPEATSSDEAGVFTYIAIGYDSITPANPPAATFHVPYIELRDNGWVEIGPFDGCPVATIPSWRVIALEDPHAE